MLLGRFLLVFIRFHEKQRVFLGHRSAREITPTRLAICRAAREIAATRLLICRADVLMNLWALTKDFRAHTNC